MHGKMMEALRDRLGIDAPPKTKIVGDLSRTEWCPEFERHMRDRLVMGAMRYGRMGAPGKPQYDRVPDMIRRLKAYAAAGNLEHLIDTACIAMMEYVEGDHPNRHFVAQDDGEHTEEKL